MIFNETNNDIEYFDLFRIDIFGHPCNHDAIISELRQFFISRQSDIKRSFSISAERPISWMSYEVAKILTRVGVEWEFRSYRYDNESFDLQYITNTRDLHVKIGIPHIYTIKKARTPASLSYLYN